MTTNNAPAQRLLPDSGARYLEQPGYVEISGDHLYTVLHEVTEPWARVLLVGPFAAERHLSYIPWVRWARYLASRGIECLRFDYRGIGESTGSFTEVGFEHWLEDVALLAAWLKQRSPETPLVLHGLELGAFLAARTFARGFGEGLLLWALPGSANQALRAMLQRRIALDNAFKFGSDRKPLSEFIRQLENGQLDVGGYLWTSRLWHDSFKYELPAGLDEQSSPAWKGKPVRIVKQDKLPAPLVKGSSVGYEAINRDFSELFAENLQWLTAFHSPRERVRS